MDVKKTVLKVVALLLLCNLFVACSRSEDGVYYPSDDGIAYTGEGSTETFVDVAIQSTEGIIYFGKVKIIDDSPTVWKALKAIVENDVDDVDRIDKDEQGLIIQINEFVNNEHEKWSLLVDNVEQDQNVEDIEVFNDQGITLLQTSN
ncbi:hypothetical protein [Paenibacillus glacialis]|uniref:DUF3221 domain-containing protein n=1 Tax=Paenibacillus glacialis TaxID=494026 RepID=A0A168ML29_9BACL|nr:hypothetical protein [Paenibacillus glacialis]OAB44802.1 hypothetical protein PGLA_05160 [Paenibacillus glacialis]